MEIKYKRSFILILITLGVIAAATLFLPGQSVLARDDLGQFESKNPLTTAVPSRSEFEFDFQTDNDLTIRAATLYECKQSDCQDAVPAEEFADQHFSCKEVNCTWSAFFYLPYHRLEVTFSDRRTRESNVFTKPEPNADFRVEVRDSDLLVEGVGEFTHEGPSLKATAAITALVFALMVCVAVLPSIGLLIVTGVLVKRAGQNLANFSDSRKLVISSWVFSQPRSRTTPGFMIGKS